MKILLVIFVLFQSANLFADQYTDCLDRIHTSHYEQINLAQERLRRDSEDCFRYPQGEAYYKCQHKAQLKHKKAVEKEDAILKQRMKSCAKFPWI